MKKSSIRLIVIAMSAVFALSACERRQRPPKPKAADTSQKNNDKKPDGETLTDGKTNTTQGGGSKTPEQAGAAETEQKIQEELAAIGQQLIALMNLKLGVTEVTNSAGAKESSLDPAPVLKAIRDQADANTASGADGAENAENLAGRLHAELTKYHDLVTTFQKTYSDEKGTIQIEGFNDDQMKKLDATLKIIETEHRKIDDLDEALHKEYPDSFPKSPAGHLDPK